MEGQLKLPILIQKLARLAAYAVVSFLFVGCNAPKGTLFYGALSRGEPVLITATGVTAGAQAIVAYDLDGNFLEVIADTTYDNLTPRGLAGYDARTFLAALDGLSDQLLKIPFVGSRTQFLTNSNFSGNIYQMDYHRNSGTYFVIKTNTIEGVTYDGQRLGAGTASIIPTTIGSCVLNTPRGLRVNQSADRMYVTNTGGTDLFLTYNISNVNSPTCASTNSTMGALDPIAIVPHSNGLVYVSTIAGTNDRIFALNADGSGSATSVFNDSTQTILMNPTAMVELPDGTILVANDGLDQIDRFQVDGANAATKVGTAPFIKNAFTGFVSDMIIVGGQ